MEPDERIEGMIGKHETDPELLALLEKAKNHVMTPEEIEAQKASWVRGMTARCEHGWLDFEQCPKCRGWE